MAVELRKEKERRDKAKEIERLGLEAPPEAKEIDLRKLMKLTKKQKEDFDSLMEEYDDNNRKLEAIRYRYEPVLPEVDEPKKTN